MAQGWENGSSQQTRVDHTAAPKLLSQPLVTGNHGGTNAKGEQGKRKWLQVGAGVGPLSLLPPQSEPQQLWASGGPSVKPHCPRLLSLARGLSWQMTAKPGCQRTGRVWASPASLQTSRRVVPTCSPSGPTQGWSISQVTRHLQELLNFTKSSCPLSTPQGC